MYGIYSHKFDPNCNKMNYKRKIATTIYLGNSEYKAELDRNHGINITEEVTCNRSTYNVLKRLCSYSIRDY